MRNNEYYKKLEEESLMRLSMLEDERIRRRRQNGIDYYVPNAMQKKAHQSDARTILYSGGNRCLGGETEIYDPVEGKSFRIDSIGKEFHVLAWNGERLVQAKASKPFEKGSDWIYEVTLSDGSKFSCSLSHRILTPDGWKSVSEVQVGCLVFRPQSNLERVQKVPVSNDLNFSEKVQGSQFDYQVYSYSCDGQPLLLEDTFRDVSPFQGDALGRISHDISLDEDDFQRRKVRIHSYQQSFPLSNLGDQNPTLGLHDDNGYCFFCTTLKSSGLHNSIVEKSKREFSLLKPNSLTVEYPNFSCNTYSPSYSSFLSKYSQAVISIVRLRYDVKWDITVPKYHNYFACGAIHHNSGKTMWGAAELCFHLTKKYPNWFSKARRFKGPIKAVISATEFPVITRVIEPKIKRLLPEGYYKIVRRGGYMSRIECIDGSTVDILTLEMANEAYESADWDFFWGDEPQSKSKFEGVLRGLIDRRGLAILTFTPLTEPWMKEDLIDKADGKSIDVFQVRMRDNMEDVEGNKILSEESISEFEKMVSEDTRETRLGGVFFHLRGAVYKEFSESHIMDDIKYEFPDPVITVLDPHDRLPHHVIWAFVNKNDDIFVDHESVIRCELEDLAKHILRIERERGYKVRRRIIDPNFGRKPYTPGGNLSVMQELARYGCPFFEGLDDKELGHMVVREYLHWDHSRPLTALNMPKLFFSRGRCPATIRSMKNLQFEDWSGITKDKKNPKEVEQDKENHGADTIRYLCVSKPRYAVLRESRDRLHELETAPY